MPNQKHSIKTSNRPFHGMRGWLLALFVLSGCAAPTVHDGECAASHPLLVASGSVNTASPPTPTWDVVWPDGRVESWTVDTTTKRGPVADSRVVAHDGLAADRACGVAAFHGSYPGESWPPAGFPEGPWQVHMVVVPARAGGADPAPLEQAIRDIFFHLPADASVPDCSDGVSLAYSAHLDGRSHRSRAYCQWGDDFDAFRAAAAAWLGEAGVRR